MNRRALLDSLDHATSDIPQLKDVVAPFGFEVSSEFVPGPIRPQRLYLYAIGHEPSTERVVSTELADWILEHRGLFADSLGRDLSYVTANSREYVHVVAEDGLGVHIYVVPSDADDDLLLAYSHYVALLPLAVSTGVLREFVYFDERPSCRRFVFQVARMLPFIHGIAYSNEEEEALRHAAAANGSRMPGNPLRVEAHATRHDHDVLHTIVLPTCNLIAQSLASDAVNLRWIDFHSRAEHVLRANRETIRERAEFIAESYRSWGLEVGSTGG